MNEGNHMKVVIIAAGMGSRLWGQTNKVPKTLLPYGDGTILSTILRNFQSIGHTDIALVIGFEKSYIVEYLTDNDNFGLNIEFIENDEWERGNGLSVLAAHEAIRHSPFILSMSDHIVSPEALNDITHDPSEHNLLLVDTRIDEVFDIDDATKVQIDNGKIVAIGKELTTFNAVDCGIFRLTERFFTAMKDQAKNGKESISAGIQKLIEANDMRAVRMKPHHRWIDLDTPESYIHARRQFDSFT
jgi:1L-myo-inositol 1-phosphate cytidylyltransferase